MKTEPYLQDADVTLYAGDAIAVLRELADESVHMCVTSPPFYGLRDYGVDGQIGLEETPEMWVEKLVAVFREVRRVLRSDGTCWIELGDSYASNGPGGMDGSTLSKGGRQHESSRGITKLRGGCKPKDLIGAPWLLAFALRADGWYLRQCIVWEKLNPMPESVGDRCTTSHSYIFLLTKSPRYFMDMEAIREPHSPDGRKITTRTVGNGSHDNYQDFGHEEGRERWPNSGRNARSVWRIATEPFSARALPGGGVRKVSPDCPVHGDRRPQATTAPDDGRADAPSTRTQRTDARPAQEPLDDSAPTGPLPEQDSAPGSSGSPPLVCADSATPHNTGSRRTDPASATSPPCTPSAQTPDHTGGTSASPDASGSAERTPESSISEDDSDAHLSDQRGPRSERKSLLTGGAYSPPGQTPHGNARQVDPNACTCTIPDHFATFPQALVRRCILAGTSERGCCPVCGGPWVRETEMTPEYKALLESGKAWRTSEGKPDEYTNRQPKDHPANVPQKLVTTGWRPSCEHRFESTDPAVCGPAPCTILDPFMGSGTTAHVARKLGRRAIGIDLNAEYLEMAAGRLAQQSLFAVNE